jgi:hypothetical protein
MSIQYFPIPNIIHFIFGLQEQNEDFLFCYYLSVYSAYIVNQPGVIFFYFHYQPRGKWFYKLQEIKCIQFVRVPLPTHIGQKEIKKTAHRADQLRLEVISRYGGIYMDIDTISVRPYTPLLSNDIVLGKTCSLSGRSEICNAVIMSRPNSLFLSMWRRMYETYFNPDGWKESSSMLPTALANAMPLNVKLLEEDCFFIPFDKIFKESNEIPNSLITLHLWNSNQMKQIYNWSWACRNKHTLYAKIMIFLKNKTSTRITHFEEDENDE